MSSYFDEASLVMIPSGYKDQKVYSVKPLDGSGDLTFSRASSATRVASNGLIEKVRTNLVLYSNDFSNAAWSKVGTTITSGQSDPYGGTSASKVEIASGGNNYLYQSIANPAGEKTISCWIKADSATTISFGSGGATPNQINVTTTWTRYSFTTTDTTGGIFFGNYFPIIGNPALTFYVFQSQYEMGVMTDYIPTTTAAVSVGPVSGLPRLDYLNSTCPRLLLEPQRSNLMLYSEQFNNAAWSKNATTITANAATSPDGYTNADKLIVDNGASLSSISNYALQSITKAASAIQYTYSIFAKQSGLNRVNIIAQGASVANNASATFSLVNGTITTAAAAAGAFTGASASVSDYGNGWYRCTLVFTTNTDTDLIIRNIPTDSTLTTGNGTNGILIYGAQLEAGAYATSYIPTLGTSVTRVEDDTSKTGISSLIGQTNGTFFVDVTFGNSRNSWFFSLVGSTNWIVDSFYLETFGASNYIAVSTAKNAAGAGGASSTIAAATGVRAKIAVQYTSTTLNMFVNGVKYTGTRTAIPACTGLYLNHIGTFGVSDNQYNANRFNQVLTFTSALTDAQCIELTTL